MIVEVVPSALAGERLDRIVALLLDVSRSAAAAVIEAGGATVDGERCTTGKLRLELGQEVGVDPSAVPVAALPGPDAAVAFGVYPANHASTFSSAVPVFPATGRPNAARVPVPDWTFCSRMRVTIAAVPSEMARRRIGVPQPASVSTVPSARTTRRIAIGSA